jgi:AcrR family transcriptional regulator
MATELFVEKDNDVARGLVDNLVHSRYSDEGNHSLILSACLLAARICFDKILSKQILAASRHALKRIDMAGETRKKILEATERLIQLKGLARVTTKEIARATGLSEGALYRHFEHKEEVFFEVLLQYLPSFLDTFKIHIPGAGTLVENLEAIALAAIDYYGKLIPMSASFFSDTDLLLQYRETLHQTSAGPHHFFELVAAYVEEEQQMGRIEPHIPAMSIAVQLLGPCFQYEFLRLFTGDLPFNQTPGEFVKTLVQGLAPGHFSAQ